MNPLSIIDKYRMSAGLTRRQLADLAGVSIKRINNGAKLTVVDVQRIIKVLGVSSTEFWSNNKSNYERLSEEEKYIVVFSKLAKLGFNTQEKLEQVIDIAVKYKNNLADAKPHLDKILEDSLLIDMEVLQK